MKKSRHQGEGRTGAVQGRRPPQRRLRACGGCAGDLHPPSRRAGPDRPPCGAGWVGDLALFARQVRLVSVGAAIETRRAPAPGGARESHPRQSIHHDGSLRPFSPEHGNRAEASRQSDHLALRDPCRLAAVVAGRELTDGRRWIEISQGKLAELVSLSVPTLQRALRQLEASGLIELGYRRIRIVDRPVLLRYCGEPAAPRLGRMP